MNVDITNIGHYRIISHGGRKFDLFNRQNDVVVSITHEDYRNIKDHMSTDACKFIEDKYAKVSV